MRLIDVDKAIEDLKQFIKDYNLENLAMVLKIITILQEQPIAFDVDKVVEKIDKDINWYQFLKDNLKCNGTVITSDRGVITTKQTILQNVKDIIKAGGIDEVNN